VSPEHIISDKGSWHRKKILYVVCSFAWMKV